MTDRTPFEKFLYDRRVDIAIVRDTPWYYRRTQGNLLLQCIEAAQETIDELSSGSEQDTS